MKNRKRQPTPAGPFTRIEDRKRGRQPAPVDASIYEDL
jgi:hypothetical protein